MARSAKLQLEAEYIYADLSSCLSLHWKSVDASPFVDTYPGFLVQSELDERFALKSSVENTWPRCSYPELTMHSGSQLACSEFCPQNWSSQWTIRQPIHRIGA